MSTKPMQQNKMKSTNITLYTLNIQELVAGFLRDLNSSYFIPLVVSLVAMTLSVLALVVAQCCNRFQDKKSPFSPSTEIVV